MECECQTEKLAGLFCLRFLKIISKKGVMQACNMSLFNTQARSITPPLHISLEYGPPQAWNVTMLNTDARNLSLIYTKVMNISLFDTS